MRHGSAVQRRSIEGLDAAVEELRREAEAIRSEGPLAKVSSLRDLEPGQLVHARLELSTGRMLRGRDAGVDVMGDGSMVPYRGAVRRQALPLRRDESPFDAVGEALAGNR